MGVRICDWKDVRQDIGSSTNGKSFRHIIYRSVDFNRDQNIGLLYHFFREHLGKDYGLTVKKLRQETTIDSIEQEEDMERTFFCSELIAKAFKECGVLIDDNTSCTQFTPNSFSQRGQKFLKLRADAVIHRERKIIIDEDETASTSKW